MAYLILLAVHDLLCGSLYLEGRVKQVTISNRMPNNFGGLIVKSFLFYKYTTA